MKTLFVFSIVHDRDPDSGVLALERARGTSTATTYPDYRRINAPQPFQSHTESLDESDVRRIVRAELEGFKANLDGDANVVARTGETDTATVEGIALVDPDRVSAEAGPPPKLTLATLLTTRW